MMSKNNQEKPLILAVETSGRLGSVALASDDRLLDEKKFTAPLRHNAELLPAIQELLARFNRKPKHIDQIHISFGPGSFTGLRIAVTFAKTMRLANTKLKIVPVDTLDVIAANAVNLTTQNIPPNPALDAPTPAPRSIAAILDAKRSQFFIAAYQPTPPDNKIWTKILPDSLLTASDFLDRFPNEQKPLWLIGEGLVYYKDKFEADGVYFFDPRLWYPTAAKVYLLGRHLASQEKFADPLTLKPNYLRTPDLRKKTKTP